jgi:hypothetical protein
VFGRRGLGAGVRHEPPQNAMEARREGKDRDVLRCSPRVDDFLEPCVPVEQQPLRAQSSSSPLSAQPHASLHFTDASKPDPTQPCNRAVAP